MLGYIFTEENGRKPFPTQGAHAELGKHSKAERFYLGSCYWWSLYRVFSSLVNRLQLNVENKGVGWTRYAFLRAGDYGFLVTL